MRWLQFSSCMVFQGIVSLSFIAFTTCSRREPIQHPIKSASLGKLTGFLWLLHDKNSMMWLVHNESSVSGELKWKWHCSNHNMPCQQLWKFLCPSITLKSMDLEIHLFTILCQLTLQQKGIYIYIYTWCVHAHMCVYMK